MGSGAGGGGAGAPHRRPDPGRGPVVRTEGAIAQRHEEGHELRLLLVGQGLEDQDGLEALDRARAERTTPSALPSTSILITATSSASSRISSSGIASTTPSPSAASTRDMPVFEIAGLSGPGAHAGMSMSTRRQDSWIAAWTVVERSARPLSSRLRKRPA